MSSVSPRWALALVVFASAPILLTALGGPSLVDPDEPRFAEASRQMLLRHDYLTPYFNGEPRFEKPIVLYWMQVLAYRAFGVNEFSARLPVALCGVVSVVLVYLLGASLFDGLAGLLGALALATLFRFLVYARLGLTDVPVLMFMLGALYGFVRTLDEDSNVAGRFATFAWIALSLAMATKGPVGLIPLLVWLSFLVLAKRWDGFRRLHVFRGLILFAAIGLPWYLYMIWRHGSAYLDLALFSEVFARYTSENFPGRPRGFFYYCKVWPGDAAPWSAFIFSAMVFVVVRWRHFEERVRKGLLLLLLWFLAVLLIFSFSRYKLPHYILPLYPPLALLVGFFFARVRELSDRFEPRWYVALPTWVTGVLYLILGALSFLFLVNVLGSSFGSPGMLVPLGFAVGAVTAVYFERISRPLGVFAAVAGSAMAIYLVLVAHTVPIELERFKATRPLAEIIAEHHRPGDRVGLFKEVATGLVYYSGLHVEWLETREEVRSFLAGENRRFCVLPRVDYEKLAEDFPGRLYLIGERRTFRMHLRDLLGAAKKRQYELVLIANRAVDESERVVH